MWTTRYITRDPADVVDEIATYVTEWGVENLNFCDLTAVLKRSWILAFCDALDARGLDITWQLPSGTRSEVLDPEVLQRMYDTGARNVTYNPETGSKELLKTYKKQVRLDRMMGSLQAARDVGMVTRTCYIVGHPEESRRDILKDGETPGGNRAGGRGGCIGHGVRSFSGKRGLSQAPGGRPPHL